MKLIFLFSKTLLFIKILCILTYIYLHKIYNSLKNILEREKRTNLYEKTIKFINLRVELDLASFREDIWSH